jgi:hypothetical protein
VTRSCACGVGRARCGRSGIRDGLEQRGNEVAKVRFRARVAAAGYHSMRAHRPIGRSNEAAAQVGLIRGISKA